MCVRHESLRKQVDALVETAVSSTPSGTRLETHGKFPQLHADLYPGISRQGSREENLRSLEASVHLALQARSVTKAIKASRRTALASCGNCNQRCNQTNLKTIYTTEKALVKRGAA